MRGKGEALSGYGSRGGITPAYAGKRVDLIIDFAVCQGSPPPMRGKVFMMLARSYFLRITPAYAGKSGYWCNRCGCWQDHPRLCGEKEQFNVLLGTA